MTIVIRSDYMDIVSSEKINAIAEELRNCCRLLVGNGHSVTNVAWALVHIGTATQICATDKALAVDWLREVADSLEGSIDFSGIAWPAPTDVANR